MRVRDEIPVGQLMSVHAHSTWLREQVWRSCAEAWTEPIVCSIGATLFRLLCGSRAASRAPDLSPLAKLRLLASISRRVWIPYEAMHGEGWSSLLLSCLRAIQAIDSECGACAEQLAVFAEGSDLNSLIKEAMSRDAGNRVEGWVMLKPTHCADEQQRY